MTLVSLITSRWLAVNGEPAMVIENGFRMLPITTDAIIAFCWSEFQQVPTQALAIRVRETLSAIATERDR